MLDRAMGKAIAAAAEEVKDFMARFIGAMRAEMVAGEDVGEGYDREK